MVALLMESVVVVLQLSSLDMQDMYLHEPLSVAGRSRRSRGLRS